MPESVIAEQSSTAAALPPSDRSQRLQQIIMDTGPLLVSRYAAAAIGLLTTMIATRWLGVDGFGRASLALAYPMLLWSVASIKSVSITTRYISSFRASGEHANLKGMCLLGYLVDLGVALGAAIILLATALPVAARVYRTPDLGPLMIAFGVSFPLYSLVGTNQAILTSFGRFGALAGLTILESVLLLLFVAGGWLFDGTPMTYVLAMAASQALAGLAGFSVAAAALRGHLGGAWWHGARLSVLSEFTGELRSFFGWNYSLVTASGVVDQLPAMLLGRYSSVSSVGYYRLAKSLMVMVGYVEASLRRAVYPKLVEDWNAGGIGRVRRDLRAMTARIGIPAGLLIVAGSFIVTPYAVPLLFGSGYTGMILGAELMLASTGISVALFWLNPYYYSAGHVALWSKIYLANSIAFVAVLVVVCRAWGFTAVAVVVSASKITLAASALVAARSRAFQRPS